MKMPIDLRDVFCNVVDMTFPWHVLNEINPQEIEICDQGQSLLIKTIIYRGLIDCGISNIFWNNELYNKSFFGNTLLKIS